MAERAEKVVYKLLRPAEWDTLEREGRSAGSSDDLRDGFIHLSAARQLAGTLGRHFARPEDRELMLLALPVAALGDALCWEASRKGELFPHLYAELRLADVAWRERLGRDAAGDFVLPDRIGP